nr:hypothetical protein CFP56_75931 [Quercus suber]
MATTACSVEREPLRFVQVHWFVGVGPTMTQINLYSETLSREIRSLTKSTAREPSNGARRWRMNSPLSWQRLQGGSHERFECPREILELKLYWSSSRDLGFAVHFGFGVVWLQFEVLGTDAGGTREIVDHNVTGLLHPLGRPGPHVLAQNLRFFLKNPLAREQMGTEGQKKVERMYLKRQMYKRFVEVLVNCMKTK